MRNQIQSVQPVEKKHENTVIEEEAASAAVLSVVSMMMDCGVPWEMYPVIELIRKRDSDGGGVNWIANAAPADENYKPPKKAMER